MTEGPEGHLYCQKYTKIHRCITYGDIDGDHHQ